MKFLTRLFKPKPNNMPDIVQYLYEQTQALQLEHFRWYQKEITEQQYIMTVDEIIGKMNQWIHESNLEDQPEWMKPKVYKPKKRRRKKK